MRPVNYAKGAKPKVKDYIRGNGPVHTGVLIREIEKDGVVSVTEEVAAKFLMAHTTIGNCSCASNKPCPVMRAHKIMRMEKIVSIEDIREMEEMMQKMEKKRQKKKLLELSKELKEIKIEN